MLRAWLNRLADELAVMHVARSERHAQFLLRLMRGQR